ncbi:MAG: SGNH/GDSL hydrolase family protein [Planctomycetes bacterium]|nr:SGNH/GDSL hydrolase family protein [Planctomycetota bacterium]
MPNPSTTERADRDRALALGLGLVVATALAAVAWKLRGSTIDLDSNVANAELVAALTTRQLAPRGLEFDPTARATARPIERVRLSAAETHAVFAAFPNMDFDPDCYYRFRGGLEERWEFPEMPKGFWTRRTNAEGAREDHELARNELDTFVLAIGDSHTEGLCDNADSWPNRLEGELSARRPGKRIEVYNTGTSSYSLFHYWGVLEKFLPERPDCVIVCMYGGNDFIETLRPYAFQRGVPLPPRPEGYFEKLVAALDLGEGPLLQGLNQALFFREHPEQRDIALTAACAAFDGIRRLCEERRVPWLAVYVPSVFDLPFDAWADVRARAKGKLALSDDDLAAANRLADALLARTRASGGTWLDLRDHLALDQRWYWSEMHLNIHANEHLARLLAPLVNELAPGGVIR